MRTSSTTHFESLDGARSVEKILSEFPSPTLFVHSGLAVS